MTARHRADVSSWAPVRDAVADALPSPRVVAATAAGTALITGGFAALQATEAYAYTVNGDGTVTVQSGDTASEIAFGEGVSTQSTLDANGLGWNTLIFPGQILSLGGDPRTNRAVAPTVAAPEAPVTQEAPVAATASTSGSDVVKTASRYLGVPYVYGGEDPTGFDCSGLTQYVFGKYGVSLPRTSTAQKSSGVRVSASEARAGDLVTFNGLQHVAIYAGDGYIIDAPHRGEVVQKRKLWTTDVTYRRVL